MSSHNHRQKLLLVAGATVCILVALVIGARVYGLMTQYVQDVVPREVLRAHGVECRVYRKDEPGMTAALSCAFVIGSGGPSPKTYFGSSRYQVSSQLKFQLVPINAEGSIVALVEQSCPKLVLAYVVPATGLVWTVGAGRSNANAPFDDAVPAWGGRLVDRSGSTDDDCKVH